MTLLSPEYLVLSLYDMLIIENVFPRPSEFDCKCSPLIGGYFFDELIKSIRESKEIIRVVQYQWKWNIHERFSKVQILGAEIAKARTRNVNIRVILNQESPKRNLSKINSVSNDMLARLGCETRMLRTASILHTKMWIIDNKYTFTGSHNISGRSLTINEETSVKIDSETYASFMTKYFDNLWNSR